MHDGKVQSLGARQLCAAVDKCSIVMIRRGKSKQTKWDVEASQVVRPRLDHCPVISGRIRVRR